jgi:hypothetical protein
MAKNKTKIITSHGNQSEQTLYRDNHLERQQRRHHKPQPKDGHHLTNTATPPKISRHQQQMDTGSLQRKERKSINHNKNTIHKTKETISSLNRKSQLKDQTNQQTKQTPP